VTPGVERKGQTRHCFTVQGVTVRTRPNYDIEIYREVVGETGKIFEKIECEGEWPSFTEDPGTGKALTNNTGRGVCVYKGKIYLMTTKRNVVQIDPDEIKSMDSNKKYQPLVVAQSDLPLTDFKLKCNKVYSLEFKGTIRIHKIGSNPLWPLLKSKEHDPMQYYYMTSCCLAITKSKEEIYRAIHGVSTTSEPITKLNLLSSDLEVVSSLEMRYRHKVVHIWLHERNRFETYALLFFGWFGAQLCLNKSGKLTLLGKAKNVGEYELFSMVEIGKRSAVIAGNCCVGKVLLI